LLPPQSQRIKRQGAPGKSKGCVSYDYSQSGAYFVTICTHQRLPLFGEIRGNEMHLNNIGEIAASCWLELPDHFPQVELDVWVVMPNHVHGIVVIIDMQTDEDGCVVASDGRAMEPAHVAPGCAVVRPCEAQLPEIRTHTLGTIINSYKGAVTRNTQQSLGCSRLWQGRFHDHIIRNARDLQAIREYVAANPARWHEDRFFME
jgi:putative transposase